MTHLYLGAEFAICKHAQVEFSLALKSPWHFCVIHVHRKEICIILTKSFKVT